MCLTKAVSQGFDISIAHFHFFRLERIISEVNLSLLVFAVKTSFVNYTFLVISEVLYLLHLTLVLNHQRNDTAC